MHALSLVHEGEDRVRVAEKRLASRKGKVGRFFASIGLSRAENSLAHSYLLRDQEFFTARRSEGPPVDEAPSFSFIEQ